MTGSRALGAARNKRLYQTSGTRLSAIGTGAGTAAFVVWAIASRDPEIGAFAALLLLLTWRLASGGFHVSDHDVRLSGLVFSRRFQWAEVDRFAAMPMGRYPHAAYIVLGDHRRYTSVVLLSSSAEMASGRVSVKTIVDELNQLLAGRRAADAVARRATDRRD